MADLETADLSNLDVLYTGAAGGDVHVDELVDATSQVLAFVNSGGGLVAETNALATNSWTWVPDASLISHSGASNLGGMETSITDPDHPVMQGLNGDDLSDWGISVHSTFLTPEAAGFQEVAEGENASGIFEPYIIVKDPGVTPLIFEITSLPAAGTLEAIIVAGGNPQILVALDLPATLFGFPVVTYTNTITAVADSFDYRVTEGLVISTAVVGLFLNDSCAEVGRPPGCTPDN